MCAPRAEYSGEYSGLVAPRRASNVLLAPGRIFVWPCGTRAHVHSGPVAPGRGPVLAPWPTWRAGGYARTAIRTAKSRVRVAPIACKMSTRGDTVSGAVPGAAGAESTSAAARLAARVLTV